MTQERSDDGERDARFRIRLIAAASLLVGLAFVQDPGLLVGDTKFDLVLDPGHFLGRALHLWDAEGAFGQLQNQAYGYLWPMGPFFWLGTALGLPGWAVQRLWTSLVLVVAFGGAARVTRALGVRRDAACLIAGAAFALSPRMLTTLGPTSIEAWPSALAPWVLLPLIHGSRRGSPRRAAALSAVAIGMVGGVNAVATFAVIPLGAIWILTRTRGPRRRSLLGWWPTFTLVTTAWWLAPLFLMGAYSPPFLDFIESASVTTFPTTVFDTVRGTSDWVPYVDSGWRAGRDLITVFFLPLNSALLLGLGLAGLSLRGTRERLFLGLGLAVGVLLVTFGHDGAVSGWWAHGFAGLLDGVLAPLRNVHKFDVVLRLPLVVGLGWATQALLDWLAGLRAAHHGRRRTLARLLSGTAALLVAFGVAAAALPAFQGRLTPSGGFTGVPDYWRQTADWLAPRADRGSALLLPGSSFADYVWGSPRDEPLQSLARSRWAVRNAIPLTPAGNIRMLDAIESRINQGYGSPGLADYLRRAGVRYLVVRNDLERDADVPDPVLVHQALAQTPGVSLAAAFGPEIGGDAHLESDSGRVVVNGGWQSEYPAVEVYEVDGTVSRAVRSTESPVVVGGPEDLLGLADAGLLSTAPTELAVDLEAGQVPTGQVLLTDGLLARERSFGRLHDSASPVLTPDTPRRSGNPVRDYRLENSDRWSTTAQIQGAERISASSSASDATTIGGAHPGQLPYAAVDGQRATEWFSGSASGPAFWRIDLEQPVTATQIEIVGGALADDDQTIEVDTEAGSSSAVEVGPGQARVVDLPPGETSWIEVRAPAGTSGRLALAEVRIPGVQVRRTLVLPELPDDWSAPDAILLRALDDQRSGCAQVDGAVRCVEGRAWSGEEAGQFNRRFDLPASSTYGFAATARPRPGPALLQRLQADGLVTVTSSSMAVPDLRASALAAVDGDPGTTWTAASADRDPSLTVSWLGERRITGLRVVTSPDAAAQRPTRVTMSWPEGQRTVILDKAGRARFAALRTDHLTVRIDATDDALDVGFDARSTPIGPGISEIRLRGLPHLSRAPSTTPQRFGCGSGPRVVIDGVVHRTSVFASEAEVMSGLPLSAEPCGTDMVVLGAGVHRIEMVPSRLFGGERLTFQAASAATTTPAVPVSVSAPTAVERRLGDSGRGSGQDVGLVALRENANAGWTATVGSQTLQSVTIDGWQQGFVAPSGRVTVRFAPDGLYRAALFDGLCLAAFFVVGVLLPWRRPWPGVELSALRAVTVPRVWPAVTVAVAGLIAGWSGLAVAVGVGVVGWALAGRLGDRIALLVALGPLVAALAYAINPWGSASGWAGAERWPQLVMLASVTATLMLVAPADSRRPGGVDADAAPVARPADRPTPRPPG